MGQKWMTEKLTNYYTNCQWQESVVVFEGCFVVVVDVLILCALLSGRLLHSLAIFMPGPCIQTCHFNIDATFFFKIILFPTYKNVVGLYFPTPRVSPRSNAFASKGIQWVIKMGYDCMSITENVCLCPLWWQTKIRELAQQLLPLSIFNTAWLVPDCMDHLRGRVLRWCMQHCCLHTPAAEVHIYECFCSLVVSVILQHC